jgi:type VI secretion system secreted protein VgrG
MKHLFTKRMARGPCRLASTLGLPALALSLLFVGNAVGAQAPVPVGNAGTFGAISAAAMTNAGLNTVVTGHVGSSTSVGSGVTNPGFSTYGAGSTQLANAQASLLTAYGNAEAQTPTGNITGMNLAGQTLTPGVYNSTGSILISGPTPLTLNGNGNADSVFIFQAAASGDLTVDPTSNVVFTNGAQPCNVFWKVQSAFLKNTGFTFVGTIFALTQITLTDSITVQGRLLARNADVTFIHDTVNVPSTCVSQADVDSAAAQAAADSQAAAQAAAAATAAANLAATNAAAAAAAASNAAAATTVATKAALAANVAATAQVAATKAAATAKAAAATAAKAKTLTAAKAAAAKAARAAKVAAAKATAAKAAAATAITSARIARATSARNARPAKVASGFTG